MARDKYKYIEVTPATHLKIKTAAAAAGVPIRIFIENALNDKLSPDNAGTERAAAKKAA